RARSVTGVQTCALPIYLVYHPTLDPQKDAQQQFIKDLHRALTVDEVREIYFDTVSEILPADGIGFYRFEFPDADRLVERQATLRSEERRVGKERRKQGT